MTLRLSTGLVDEKEHTTLYIGSDLMGWSSLKLTQLGFYQRAEVEQALESKAFDFVLYFGDDPLYLTNKSVSLQYVEVFLEETEVRDLLKRLLTI
jgi:hypothetical protein